MAGTLFVVATPIGNLEDLSFRALRVLKEVDLIAAEDTRRTLKLLSHYGIRQSMVSLHEHNEVRETPRLIERLKSGTSIALVSDAGTPGIADPGAHLVRAAREAHIAVSPVPGPSAVMAALSASGVEASEFVFMGFPPRSGAERSRWFSRLAAETRTAVFFEAPHRIDKTAREARLALVDRPIHIHRELTKIHEEYVISTNKATETPVRPEGEFVIVVDSIEQIEDKSNITASKLDKATRLFGCITDNCSIDEVEALEILSRGLEVDGSAIRKAVKKARIARKQRDQAHS
jgi:16S rRNA (cytidine1402-2'-O)-methyltransferase